MTQQRTLREKVSCCGIGLHTGASVHMEVLPATTDAGIVFVRTDLPLHPEVHASIGNLTDTTLATTLSVQTPHGRAHIGTVEHLLAAFYGMGIDNARVLLDGPEVPILDGSASPFVELFVQAGLEEQRRPRRYMAIKKDVRVADGDKFARIGPSRCLKITCSLDFDHPLISPTPLTLQLSCATFCRDVAPARTFGFLQDVEALRARGLARGGSLHNALVIDDYRVLNPEGLRFADEFVRHKLLDTLGDLALFGMPLLGRVQVHRAGHALHAKLVRAVLCDPRNYEVAQPAPAEAAVAYDLARIDLFEAKKSMA